MAGRKTNSLELQSLKNIGPAVASWLDAVGIHTREDLERVGAVGAYLKIRELHHVAANKMALYALYGAIHDTNCLKLAPEIKDMLNQMVEDADSGTAWGKK